MCTVTPRPTVTVADARERPAPRSGPQLQVKAGLTDVTPRRRPGPHTESAHSPAVRPGAGRGSRPGPAGALKVIDYNVLKGIPVATERGVPAARRQRDAAGGHGRCDPESDTGPSACATVLKCGEPDSCHCRQ